MDAAEIERELEELETRIERVRALYEQYFMGLEKIEPLIQRKDIDRRIWVLRREQIRNTGLRFKFQMLIQRYNTFQQYWQRINREIENGTYRRDVLRAAQRVGEREALTIVGRKRAEQYARLIDAQAKRRRPAGSNDVAAPPEVDDIDVELSSELVNDAPPGPSAKPAAPAPADPAEARRRVAALAAQVRAERRARSSAPAGPLDLDLDLEGGRRTSRPPNDGAARRVSTPVLTAVRIPAAPRVPGADARAPAAPPMAAAPNPIVPKPPGGAAPAAGPRPAVPGQPIVRPPAAAAPGAPRSVDALSEQRMREIYTKYLAAKRAANESTAGITFEKLSSSLREQAQKLRATHQGKTVDYEIVTKDGRTLLKPVVR